MTKDARGTRRIEPRRAGRTDTALELDREVKQLRAAIGLLHRIQNLVLAAHELEPTFYSVLTSVTAGVGLGLNRAMLFLTDPVDRGALVGAAATGPFDVEEADRVWRQIESDAPDLETLYEAGLRARNKPEKLDRCVRATRLRIAGNTPVALAFRHGALVRGEGRAEPPELFHIPTSIAAPLRGRRSVAGVLYADNAFNGAELDDVSAMVFAMVADHAGRAIENATDYERLAGEARTDALTGLGHHGTLRNDLDRAIALSAREQRPLGLLMIDLDGFKQINDTLGHLAGDALLAGVSARFSAVIRHGEALYRYGGDEFAAILHGASLTATLGVGERLRASLERPLSVGGGREVSVTCSVGAASFPADAQDANSLVAAADAALLRAKGGGKNAVLGAARSDQRTG